MFLFKKKAINNLGKITAVVAMGEFFRENYWVFTVGLGESNNPGLTALWVIAGISVSAGFGGGFGYLVGQQLREGQPKEVVENTPLMHSV